MKCITSGTGGTSPGNLQPCNSYDDLADDEKRMVIINGTISDMRYVLQEESGQDQETRVQIRFKVTDATKPVVLAWGGHIASRADWGFDGDDPLSAGGIHGSPYHMRLIELCLEGETCQGGNQDRSLQAAAIFVPPPTVSGIKYHDVNGDGVRDEDGVDNVANNADDEVGLVDWTIRAYEDDGDGILSQAEFDAAVFLTVDTESDGTFEIELVADTDYVLCEVLQSGWGQTEPNLGAVSGGTVSDNPMTATVTGAAVAGDRSLFRKNQKLRIETEHLQIGNGYADDASSPLSVDRGVDGSAAETHAQTTPISILRCGIDDSLGPDGYAIAGQETGDTPDRDFGNFNLVKKSGFKKEDVNADGSLADGVALNGWVIRLYNDNDNSNTLNLNDTLKATIVTGTTGATGSYAFDGLMAGNYIVCEVIQDNWTQTVPNSSTGPVVLNDVCKDASNAVPGSGVLADGGHDFDVDTSGDTTHVNNNFGNYHFLQVLVIVCDQQTGLVILGDMNLAADVQDTLTLGQTNGLFGALADTSISEEAFNHLLCDLAQYNDLTPGDHFLGLELPDVPGDAPLAKLHS